MAILDRSSFDEYEKCGRLGNPVILKKHPWLKEHFNDGTAYIFDVPCGHCLNCRLNYAKKWSQRCLLECKSWSENFFITLTYDDENLPVITDYSTGDFMAATLVPKDVVDFLKRLREYYRIEYQHIGVRFFLAAEYGDHTLRPHYHFLAFNCPIFDLEYYAKSPLGDCYFNSKILDRLWQKGHVVIGDVTPQSAAYVARYCQKKATKSIDYDAIGIHKEYTRMSRMPGIALPYLQEHYREIYENDSIYLPDGQICTPMRYFDLKAEEMGIDIEKIKKQRILTGTILGNQKVDEVSKDFYSYLEDLEEDCKKRSKALARNL